MKLDSKLFLNFLVMSLICVGYTNTFAIEGGARVQKTMTTTEDCPEIISFDDLFKAFSRKKDTGFNFFEFDLGDKRVQMSANSLNILETIIDKNRTESTNTKELYYVRTDDIRRGRCVYFEARDQHRKITKEEWESRLQEADYQKLIAGETKGNTKKIYGMYFLPTENKDHKFGLSFKRLYMMNPELND